MDSSNVVDRSHPNKGAKNNGVPIRTVCVLGRSPNMIGEIIGHFGQFGEIESVAERFIYFNLCQYLVQFKREADAKRALWHKKRTWNIVEVTAADPLNQPDHPLQVPPEQDSESNILVALNDHCLREIFNHLKLRDLTNAAEVCVRFNEHAKLNFASERKHLDLNREFHYFQSGLVETAMKLFHKDMQSLGINSTFFKTEADAINMIAHNCGPKLKRLKLDRFQFQSDWSAVHSIFAGIEQLELQNCSASIGLVQLLAACVELKSLTLRGGNCNDPCILKQTFPKLQELSLERARDSDKTFKHFIIRHPTLTKLTIENSHILRPLRMIGRHAKNLQELTYKNLGDDDQFQNDAAFIGQLRSLKKLEIAVLWHRIVPMLNPLIVGEVPIEIMDLSFAWRRSDDDAIKYVSQLKRIKSLRLKLRVWDRRLTDAHIIELAKSLPDLEELHLEEDDVCSVERFGNYSFKSELSTIGLRKMLMHSPKLKLLELQSIDSIKIDIDDYKEMLSTVQQREETAALLIKIHLCGGGQINIPAAVLAKNRKILNIQKFRFQNNHFSTT